MILLDTNSLIWLHQGHRRARRIPRDAGPLYISPASLLELQFLLETGRIRLGTGTVSELANDARWSLDDPPAAAWFGRALEIGWTRDPFDRLLVAHARYRGWRLATGDGLLIDRLGDARALPL